MNWKIIASIICIAFLFPGHAQAGPLHDAARKGDLAGVAQLLEQGAEIDEGDGEDKAALYHAAAQNHRDIVKLLIERGADPNRIRVDVQGPVDGAIHVAAKRGHLEVIEALAAAGADLTKATVMAMAPLHLSLRHNQPEAAELLRSLGAANFTAPEVSALIADADIELGRKLVGGCNKCHALQKTVSRPAAMAACSVRCFGMSLAGRRAAFRVGNTQTRCLTWRGRGHTKNSTTISRIQRQPCPVPRKSSPSQI